MTESTDTQKRQLLREFGSANHTNLITLLFTDLVGSTALKQRLGDVQAVGLIREHHRIVRETLVGFTDAKEVGTAGDSFFIVFARPSDAVTFALLLQNALRHWNASAKEKVMDRIGIHVGEVMVEGKSEDFYGIHVDACARVMSIASAGQILVSRFAFDTARQVLRGQSIPRIGTVVWHSHGRYRLKGIEEPVEVCEVGEEGEAPLTAPSSEGKVHDVDLVTGWRPALSQTVPGTKWILTQSLGEGGFGEVWAARHQSLKEERVFKFCFQAERARSLRRELTLFRLLRDRVGTHPNIVGIQDVNLEAPPYYLVMERAQGHDLKKWFAESGGAARVTMEARLSIVAQIGDALQAAHDAGVIHRDIKPANILIYSDGTTGALTAKVTDFGMVRLPHRKFCEGLRAMASPRLSSHQARLHRQER